MSDLISRYELLEHIWRERVDSRERIAEIIKSMPSAESELEYKYRRALSDLAEESRKKERQKGKWKQMPYLVGEIEVTIPYCSECGMSTLSTAWHYPSKFCPHCGTEMEVTDE